MVDLSARKAQLETRLAELRGRLEHIEHDLDQPVSKDDEDRATEREDDEVLEGIGEAGLQEIRSIEAALQRIAAGSYGECVSCGEEIDAARLDIVPHTPLCKTCAAKR
ncbi:TraR/DksA family transcriptional regulator [Oceanomicrobium pacificus]|uniref:TraR/DksA family transcriptional regulator n=1 Tax=Oceanomicrobium pacificus TaxID=2692916 RepID=A0A6B0TNM8_9RHOB|nr:TraR/DksA C4-type zinc finger protein [Oceanomicrobium pacificus]MXU64189.1 TraR/DksA family transcriptional regulator [Oceanomicrobium pacificus]